MWPEKIRTSFVAVFNYVVVSVFSSTHGTAGVVWGTAELARPKCTFTPPTLLQYY